jgi:hypothetical protein
MCLPNASGAHADALRISGWGKLLCAIWLFGTARAKGNNSPNWPFFLQSLFVILKNLLTFAAETMKRTTCKRKVS